MLLSVYEGRLTRIMEKQRAELKALQSERKEAREKALNQAEIFVEHAEGKGKEYDLGEDFQPASAYSGFFFSPAEIAAGATASAATKPTPTTISATDRRIKGPIEARNPISDPHDSHDGILKEVQFANERTTQAQSVFFAS